MKWNQKATLISAATFSQINHGHSTANARLMIQIPYGVRNSARPWITHGRHLAAKLSPSKVRELHVRYLSKNRPQAARNLVNAYSITIYSRRIYPGLICFQINQD